MNHISHWYPWYFTVQNKGQKAIRRYRKINGKIKWETYPKAKYKDMNEEEIQSLLKRLNASRMIDESQAKQRYDFDTSYVSKRIMEDFEVFLKTRATSKDHVNTLLAITHEFVIKFFIRKQKLPNPNYWKKKESQFGNYLLSQDISAGYIKRIIQTTNRLIEFLHHKYPEEIRLTKLDPIGPNVLRHQIASKNQDRKKYISTDDYQVILQAVDSRIRPMVELAYCFGLRRAETLGLSLDCVYEESLSVERQLVKLGNIPSYSPLKSKEQRVVPYWFATAQEAYDLINSIQKVHPDTLSDKFDTAMKEIGFEYQFHDLRRTFITNALRKYHFLDVRLAAGHSDLETTQKYIQDDRRLQKKRFTPKISLLK